MTVLDPCEYVKTVLKMAPVGSTIYERAMQDLFMYYRNKNGFSKEYVLCINKDKFQEVKLSFSKKLGDGNSIIDQIPSDCLEWVWRCEAEYNLQYYQIVVGIGLVTEKSHKMVILDNINGDMAGNKTIIQGHCSYDHSPNYLYMESFDDLVHNSLIAELNEEVKFKDYTAQALLRKYHDYFFCNVLPNRTGNPDDLSIDDFHIGFIYNYAIEDSILETAISNEPDKNKLSLIPVMDILTNADDYDKWVLESAKSIYNNNATILNV